MTASPSRKDPAPSKESVTMPASNGPHLSDVGTHSSHDLTQATVSVLDANGDGFTDMMNTWTGELLINQGNGDWESNEDFWVEGETGVPPSEMLDARFIDYDNDRRIDIIRSMAAGDGNYTTVYENLGPEGFDPVLVEPIGAGFDSDPIQMNDINGDGLLDVVQVMESDVRYRLNLGWGRWSPLPWHTIALGDTHLSAQRQSEAEIEDMNGDAMGDLVLIEGNEVRIWTNRDGRTFDDEVSINYDNTGLLIPSTSPTTTVLLADMNGNGSTDVVWIEAGGEVTVLESSRGRGATTVSRQGSLPLPTTWETRTPTTMDVSYGSTNSRTVPTSWGRAIATTKSTRTGSPVQTLILRYATFI